MGCDFLHTIVGVCKWVVNLVIFFEWHDRVVVELRVVGCVCSIIVMSYKESTNTTPAPTVSHNNKIKTFSRGFLIVFS